MNPFTLSLTTEEATVMLALMQSGTRSFQGEAFDQASQSYLHLRNLILVAQKAEPKVEAVKNEDAA